LNIGGSRPAPRTARSPFRRVNIAAKIRDASDLYVKSIRARVRPHGLSLNQFRLLRELWEEDGVTQREIAQRMHVSEPATVSTIDALVEAGLVRRARDESDKRKSSIVLTARGERLRDAILRENDALNAAALAGLSADERRTLATLLDRVIGNLTGVQANTML
jgi:DNA-binding MarR family transcriptional regulator